MRQKLECQRGDDWVPHRHERVFTTQIIAKDTPRLVAGVPDGDASVVLALIDCLSPPLALLYVLHTPRGEGEPGRYESPQLTSVDVHRFFDRFARFFAGDARFDLWVHSPTGEATLVWERHNLMYGYGPLECFSRALRSLGFSEDRPVVPVPHRHHYRDAFDSDAAAVLTAFEWLHSPLQPEDEQ